MDRLFHPIAIGILVIIAIAVNLLIFGDPRCLLVDCVITKD